jgi:hypothetical protein
MLESFAPNLSTLSLANTGLGDGGLQVLPSMPPESLHSSEPLQSQSLHLPPISEQARSLVARSLVPLNLGRLRRAAQSWTRPLQRPSCSAARRMALVAPRPLVTPAARM